MMQLRYYQNDLKKQINEDLYELDIKAVMAQLVTGGGKTEIGIDLARATTQNNYPVLWLTHKQELCFQTYERFLSNDINAVYYTSKTKIKPCYELWKQGVQILSPVLYRNAVRKGLIFAPDDEYNKNGLLIIDEAHHSTSKVWAEIISLWAGKIVGLSATPWRLEKNKGFEHLYNKLICGPQIQELTPKYLAPIRLVLPIEESLIERKDIPVRTNGEFDLRLFDNNPFTLALRYWHDQKKVHNYTQTILYLPTSRSARRAAVYIKEQLGMSVGLLLSDNELDSIEKEFGVASPESVGVITDREQCITLFKEGKLECIVNCEIVTEGLDCPGANCIVILRPTKSLTLYLQMVGRGTRTAPNKEYLALFDFAQNYNEFGLPDEDREWSLKPRPSFGGEEPVKKCDNCKSICAPGKHICPWCGKSFGQDCLSCGWVSWKSWEHQNNSDVCPICHPARFGSCSEAPCPVDGLYNIKKKSEICIFCNDTNKNPHPRYCDKCLHGELLNLQVMDLSIWKKNNNKFIYKRSAWSAVVLQRPSGEWRYVILNLNNEVIKKSSAYVSQFDACRYAEEEMKTMITERKKRGRKKNRKKPRTQSYDKLLNLYNR